MPFAAAFHQRGAGAHSARALQYAEGIMLVAVLILAICVLIAFECSEIR